MNFRVLSYQVLDSTNTLAVKFAQQGACPGTVVVADYQKKGRGRFERTWVSKRGQNLLFSVVLRPKLSPSEASIITILTAQTLVRFLKDEYQMKAEIKRPNDVLVRGKKISGILTESSSSEGARYVDYVVVGIGLNVNSRGADLPRLATSIREETKKRWDRSLVLSHFLNYFKEIFDRTENINR